MTLIKLLVFEQFVMSDICDILIPLALLFRSLVLKSIILVISSNVYTFSKLQDISYNVRDSDLIDLRSIFLKSFPGDFNV